MMYCTFFPPSQQWILTYGLRSRSVGGKAVPSLANTVSSPSLLVVPRLNVNPQNTEEDVRELIMYDKNVYQASLDMTKTMSKELHRLGVPFFGTNTQLINNEERGGQLHSGDGVTDRSGIQGKRIAQQEFVQLQRKMLEMLEDLCSG